MVSQYRVSAVEVDGTVTAMANGSLGQVLYGDERGSIGEFDGLLLTEVENVGSRINALESNASGLAICAGNGLFRYSKGLQKLSGSHLDVLAVSGDRTLLLSTKGIFQKQGSSYEPLAPVGLPVVSQIGHARITEEHTARYLQLDSKVYSFTNRWRLVSDSVVGMAVRDQELITIQPTGIYSNADSLYFGDVEATAKALVTSEGRIFFTNENYISEVVDGDIRPIYSLNTETVTTLHEDAWGNIWVASPNYLYRVILEKGISLPIISLTDVNGVTTPHEVTLKEGQSLEASWTGYHLGAPSILRFQHRVVGYSDWSNGSRNRSVVIDDLPDGNYDLEVRASIDGVNFAYINPVKVRVGSALITRIWWIAMLAALAIVATAAIGIVRFNNYTTKIETDRAKLQAENRLLMLEQKALQLQMNPHFIFNALNSVKGQIAQGHSKEARASLTAFAQLMRLTLDQSRTESTTIESEVEYLERYLTLEQWVNQDQFSFEIKVGDRVRVEESIPTMLIQPFVENAIKHAFKGQDRRGQISVEILETAGALQFTITDDGVGIQKSPSAEGHQSIATHVVRERLALKYPAAKQQLLQIGPGNNNIGTKVKITIPR